VLKRTKHLHRDFAVSNLLRSLVIITSIVASSFASADNQFIPRMPDDLDQVDFYLHTIDVGVLVHEKYGHTQIRVHDRLANSDIAYSWGIFDYQDPSFAMKFYRGVMRYRIGAYQTQVVHRIYAYEGRKVWEDKLELNRNQKRRLMEKIIFQMQPENREYDYQYFFDNCSTRPRDFIDVALNGEFKTRYFSAPSPFSFRDLVRSHQATTPLSGLGLEITMNGRLDRIITKWEEMFLPKSLRQYLMEMPRSDESDIAVPGSSILTPVQEYYRSPTPTADYRNDDLLAYAIFGIAPLIMTALILAFRSKSVQFYQSILVAFTTRLFGLSLLLWSLLAFVSGTIMITSWAFSNHLDLYHNANLFLFWPLDIVLMVPAFALILRGADAAGSIRMRSLIRWLIGAHAVAAAGCGILALTGLIQQDLSRIFAVFGTCGTMIYFCLNQFLQPISGKITREQPIRQSGR
jgi:hypothetical protein